MNVCCIRHGQTNFNVSCLCNDDPDADVHLTELGIQQAEVVAERFRDIPLLDLHFDNAQILQFRL